MRTISFVIEGQAHTEITISERQDGALTLDLRALDGGSLAGIAGLYFDLDGYEAGRDLTVVGDDVARAKISEGKVHNLGHKSKVDGATIEDAGRFDVGMRFEDAVDTDTRIVLATKSGAPLTLDHLDEADLALVFQDGTMGLRAGAGSAGATETVVVEGLTAGDSDPFTIWPVSRGADGTDGARGSHGYWGAAGRTYQGGAGTYSDPYRYTVYNRDAGDGRDGGAGGWGGSGHVAAVQSDLDAAAMGDGQLVKVHADAFGGDGGDGGNGGEGGSAGATGYEVKWVKSTWTSRFEKHAHQLAHQGDGGDGGQGGQGGHATAKVQGVSAAGSAFDDIVKAVAIAQGGDGGDGGDGGAARGMFVGFDGVSGDAGAGGRGGNADASVAGASLEGGAGDDVVAVEAAGFGGTGGDGGDTSSLAGTYFRGAARGSTTSYANDGGDRNLYWSQPGVAGDGGNGGGASATIVNSTLRGGDGDDTLMLTARALPGDGGAGGFAHAGKTGTIYGTQSYTYNYIAGYGTHGDAGARDGYADVVVNGNVLDGGAGNDTIAIVVQKQGQGRFEFDGNAVIGGDGLDTLDLSGVDLGAVVELGAGTFDIGDDRADNAIGGIETVLGTKLADALTGGIGAVTLDGGAGDDLLTAGSGDTTLIGGAGADVFAVRLRGDDRIADFGEGDTLDLSGTAWIAAAIDTNADGILSAADSGGAFTVVGDAGSLVVSDGGGSVAIDGVSGLSISDLIAAAPNVSVSEAGASGTRGADGADGPNHYGYAPNGENNGRSGTVGTSGAGARAETGHAVRGWSADDTLSDDVVAVGGNGGTGGAGGDGGDGKIYTIEYSYDRLNNIVETDIAGQGGAGGSGGAGGTAEASSVQSQIAGGVGEDLLTIDAAAEGGAGGNGGAGGMAGSPGNFGVYKVKRGTADGVVEERTYYHYLWGDALGGDGGDGGAGGEGTAHILEGVLDGGADDDVLTAMASSAGGAGAFGGDGGASSVLDEPYHTARGGGNGGDGGDGGNANAVVDETTLTGGLGDDRLTIAADAVGGSGGAGGNALNATALRFTTLPGSPEYRFAGPDREQVFGAAGDGGAGGDGGDAEASLADNRLAGGDGADQLVLSATASAGLGGAGGTTDAGYTTSPVLASYGYYTRTLAGTAGPDGADGDEGTARVVISGNTVDGGAGDDNLALVADAGGGFVEIHGNLFDGGDGMDTLDLSGTSRAAGLDLAGGTLSFFGSTGSNVVTGIEAVIGTALADALVGGAASETLSGGNGTDTLEGGAGDDILTGDGGADVFVFDGLGHDRVTDFEVGVDRLDLSGALADAGLLDGNQNGVLDDGDAWGSIQISQGVDGLVIATGGASIVLMGVTALDPDFAIA